MDKKDKEYLVDDTPIDLSKYDKYSDAEIERMITEMEERHKKIKEKRSN